MTRRALLLLGLLLSLSGCSGSDSPETTSNGPARRIVTASPAATEICCALGLRERLVGRSKYCTYPPGVEAVASIGGLVDANPEKLVQIQPDLILISGRSNAQRERFKRLGLRLESLPDGTLDDIYTSIERVGLLTGRETVAAELVSTIKQGLAEVDAQYGPGDGREVLLILEELSDPPMTPTAIGPGSFLHDLLLRAGYRPAMNLHAAYAGLNLEAIARADPEVIVEIASKEGRPDLEARRRLWGRLGTLQAVESGAVLQLSHPRNTIPGPRIVQFYADLRAVLSELPARDATP